MSFVAHRSGAPISGGGGCETRGARAGGKSPALRLRVRCDACRRRRSRSAFGFATSLRGMRGIWSRRIAPRCRMRPCAHRRSRMHDAGWCDVAPHPRVRPRTAARTGRTRRFRRETNESLLRHDGQRRPSAVKSSARIGSATSAPTWRGSPAPSKRPSRTAVARPWPCPAASASAWPELVPVFQKHPTPPTWLAPPRTRGRARRRRGSGSVRRRSQPSARAPPSHDLAMSRATRRGSIDLD